MNKKVVEIVDSQHEYFEKVILFVREDKQEREEKLLHREAGRYIGGIKFKPAKLRGSFSFNRIALATLKLGGAAALGAFVMSLVR